MKKKVATTNGALRFKLNDAPVELIVGEDFYLSVRDLPGNQ
jgi:hypothetical protein